VIYFGVALSAYAIALAASPRWAGPVMLGACSLSISTIYYIIICTRRLSLESLVGEFLLALMAYSCTCMLMRFAAIVLHETVLAFYLLASSGVRGASRTTWSFFQVTWRNYDVNEATEIGDSRLYMILGVNTVLTLPPSIGLLIGSFLIY